MIVEHRGELVDTAVYILHVLEDILHACRLLLRGSADVSRILHRFLRNVLHALPCLLQAVKGVFG